MSELLQIEAMQVQDIEQVLEVERRCFSVPWSRFAFMTELTQNHYALYVVGKVDEKVVAYAGTWVVLDEAHITNVAVHPDYQGRGYGRAILLALLARARGRGADRATLEVRTSNHKAQSLYSQYGFVVRGWRRGYYTDTGEDALIMWKDDLSDIALCTSEHDAGQVAMEGSGQQI